jgi:hypothetical protein
MLIAIGVVIIVVGQLWPIVWTFVTRQGNLPKLPQTPEILAIVAKALAYSAAIDLAYMLFTPEPDEAVEPLMLGAAAGALMWIPGPASKQTLSGLFGAAGLVAIFVGLLGFLFAVRRQFIEKTGEESLGRGATTSRNTIVDTIVNTIRGRTQP